MKTIYALVLSVGLFGAVASAQPTVSAVVNGASFSQVPLPNSSIAQGSFFSIFGKNLGPDPSSCGANLGACLWSSYPLPHTIMGTSVSITVGGTTKMALINLAISSQINGVMPSSIPPGSGTLTVTSSSGTSSAFNVTVVASSFATFAVNQAGTGPGIIQDVNYKVYSPTHTAKPGDIVIIWGTGLGPAPDVANEGVTGPCPTGCDFQKSGYTVNVYVAGQKITPQYAGRSPGLTAIDQINFQLPSNMGNGCYVTVAVEASAPGGSAVVSNFTSMTVDSGGGICSDADGVNMNDLATKLGAGQSVNVGVIDLLSNYVPLALGPGVPPLQFDNDTVSVEIGTFDTTAINGFQGFALATSVGSCVVTPFLQFPPPVDPVLVNAVSYLDAGASLSITGGQTGMQSIPKNTNGKGYSSLVGGASIANLLTGMGKQPYFLTAMMNTTGMWAPTGIGTGSYAVTGTGGKDVGAISATVSIDAQAAAFKWTNQPTSNIPRNAPLTITWTGGDPNGFVDISMISSTVTGLLPSGTTPGMFGECFAPAGAGSFTIPAYVLSALPSTLGSNGMPNSPVAGELLVGPASGAQKASTTPSGLDALYILYHYIGGVQVNWQ